MSDARWERFGAATGIAFVALLVVSFALIPDKPPELDDPILNRFATLNHRAASKILYTLRF